MWRRRHGRVAAALVGVLVAAGGLTVRASPPAPAVPQAERSTTQDLPPYDQADAPPQPTRPSEPAKDTPGLKLMVAGLGVSAAGVVMLGAGGLGAWLISELADWDLSEPGLGYGRGSVALACVGGLVTVIGVPIAITGGVRFRRSREARLTLTPRWDRRSAGVSLRLRF